MRRCIWFAFVLCAVGACRTANLSSQPSVQREPTPYQPYQWNGGYTSEEIDRGLYFVEVRVNSYTTSGTAMKYLHRRAVELCREAGYRGYSLLDSKTDLRRTGWLGHAGASYPAGPSRATYIEDQKPVVSGMVRCDGGTVSPGDADAPAAVSI